MSNVTLTIGGREYTVACADGEEAHISGLGRIIDGKLTGVSGNSRNEAMNLLFAALLLADENEDLKAKPSGAPAVPPTPMVEPERLDEIADRIENIVRLLEAKVPSA